MERQGVDGTVLTKTKDKSIGSTNSQRRRKHYKRINQLSGQGG